MSCCLPNSDKCPCFEGSTESLETCECQVPMSAYNGVCGACLMPLDNQPRAEGGALLSSSKSKQGKKLATQKYSVLLQCPDYISENYGQNTYLAHVEAKSVQAAVEQAQKEAAEVGFVNSDGNDQDFYPLLVTNGHIEDLRQR